MCEIFFCGVGWVGWGVREGKIDGKGTAGKRCHDIHAASQCLVIRFHHSSTFMC